MDADVKWTVSTPGAVYADVWAVSAHAAKRRVWRMTLGRMAIADMVAWRAQ